MFQLRKDGGLYRGQGRAATYVAGSKSWRATRLAVQGVSALLVLSARKAHRVQGEALVPLACQAAALDVSATDEAVYLVTQEHSLVRGDPASREVVAAPEPLVSVGANHQRFAVVTTTGKALLREGGSWRLLPTPVVYRSGRAPEPQEFQQVARSRHSAFALTRTGSVFMSSLFPQ